MALTLADAVVFIRGDTSSLDKDLKGAEKSTTKFFGSFSSSVNTLMAGAIAGGTALAVAGLVKVGSTAINVAFEMDSLERQFTRTLGVSKDRAAELGDLVQNVYVDGFGGSLTDVADALTVVNQGLGDLNLGDSVIQQATADALLLRDAFELDVAKSIRTVSILLKSGLAPDADTAFNIITAGMQDGLNISDDFLDTLNEYADDFARLGFTADQTLGLINAGLDAGIFNTDKIGDLLNEFGIRIREVDTDKLAEIDAGISGIIRAFQGGELSEADAFKAIIDRLNEIEDPIKRNQLGVELFGSMWEDLGAKAVLALGDFDEASITTEGRIKQLQADSDSLSARWERLQRKGAVALEPLGEAIIGLVEHSFPLLEGAIGLLTQSTAGWGKTTESAIAFVGIYADIAKGYLQQLYDKIVELTPGLQTFINGAQDWYNLAEGIAAFGRGFLGIGGSSSNRNSDPLYTPGAGNMPPLDPGMGGYGGTAQLGARDQYGNVINSQPAGGPAGGFGYNASQTYPAGIGSDNGSLPWFLQTPTQINGGVNITVQRGATDDQTGNTLARSLRAKGILP